MTGKLKYALVILAGVLIITGTAVGVKGKHAEPVETVPETASEEAASFAVYDIADMHIGNQEAQEPEKKITEAAASEHVEEETQAPVQEMISESDAASMQPVGLEAFFENKLCIDPEKVSLYLNVREAPDEESEILDVLYPDDIVTFTSRDGMWYEITRNGYTGYVNAFYVLAGHDAYDVLKDTVAYAVMAKEDGISMYENAENTDTVILYANMGDVFRVTDMDSTYYEVSVRSPIYETLVIPKSKVVLYYLFLGPGNSNELSEEAKEMFGKLNIEGNLARTTLIKQEVADREEQALLESSLLESSILEESWAAEYYGTQYTETEAAAAWTAWTPETAASEATWQWQPASTAAPSTAAPTTAPTTAPAPVTQTGSNLTYLGSFRITHYCHCTKCCGVWGSDDPNYAAHGASGLPLVSDYSVAVSVAQIPYGTRLMINGREYVAADCGVGNNCIDIYRKTHDQALAGGMYYADVYIIN